jgi:hypothetical protein
VSLRGGVGQNSDARRKGMRKERAAQACDMSRRSTRSSSGCHSSYDARRMWRHRKKEKDMMKANRNQRKENEDGFTGIDLGRVHRDKKR